MGTVNLNTDSTYSLDAFVNGENYDELMKKIKDISDDNTVITFKAIENEFCTEYYFGGIEVLNYLEGKSISVVGLPNVDEKVYSCLWVLMLKISICPI